MTLAIRPDDLSRASDHLRRVAAQLDISRERFALGVASDLPEVGAQANAAAIRGARAANHAVDVLVADIDRLGRALAELALHYPRVDHTAVPHAR
jgi:hypothetical protein